MRKIGISFLRPEMILGRSVYNSDGRVLLRAGVSLNANYIRRLQEIGIISVYIRDRISEDIEEIPELVSEETRVQTKRTLQEAFRLLERKQGIDTRKIEIAVGDLMDEIFHNNDVLLGVLDMSLNDDHVYIHSVNVGIMAMAMGLTLGYDRSKLKELGTGALLHDIGKTQLPRDILIRSQQRHLDFDRDLEMHAQHGFDILRKYYGVSLLSAHVAFQHHERWDGTGYPRGLKEIGIHEYARIVSVANVYDALMYGAVRDRVPMSAPEALAELQALAGSEIDPILVDVLAANIALFPVGSVVELNSGSLAVVIELNRSRPDLPTVRILEHRTGEISPSGPLVDLANQSSLSIIRTLPETEVQTLIRV